MQPARRNWLWKGPNHMRDRFKIIAAGLFGVMLVLYLAAGAQAAMRGLTVQLRESEASGAPMAGQVKLYAASHALVIGIDNYTNGWPRLSKAVEDARAVAAALTDKGFSVTLKINLNAADLEDALKEFYAIEGVDPQARLFLWYAGHGHTMNGEGFLIPADAPRPEQAGLFRLRALSLRRMGEYVRLAESKHAFAVFDSCFSGTVFESARALPPAAVTRATTLPVRQFLTSGDAGQTVSDDGSFRELFIRALRGEERADANGDGYITASEIGLFLTDRVTNLTQSRQTPRYGKLRDKDWDRGDFVFQVASAAPPRAVAPPVPYGARPSGGSAELLFWESIKDSKRASDHAAYLRQYPNGTFADLARSRAREFKPQQTASLPPASVQVEELDASYVALKTANVRSEPTTASAKLGSIARDAGVTVTGTVAGGKWLRIERPGGQVGYIFASLLAPVDSGEIAAWGKVKDAKAAGAVTAFLRSYPGGHFAARAKQLEAALTLQVAAVIPPEVTAPRPVKPVVGVYPGRRPGDSFKDCADCPEMVVVPSGAFRMGDLQGGGDSDEKPVHDVRIGYSFAVGKFEVTFAEWDACVSAGGCGGYRPADQGWGRGRRPVMTVSWDDAQAYVSWLSAKTGQSYRLLSEAEWEYVARAGTGTKYSWGNQFDSAKANNNRSTTRPVGSYEPNGFGLYDVHGNVWEWVEDCWHDSYQGAPTNGSAWTSGGDCSRRVLRGGAWYFNPWNLRAANRNWDGTGDRYGNLGFRLARTLSP